MNESGDVLKDSPAETGSLLRAARKRSRMTLGQVAARLNVTSPTVWKIEQGTSRSQQMAYIGKLAAIYGVSVSELGVIPATASRSTMGPQLGARAQARRELLHLSCPAVAKQLGVSYAILRQAENCLPSKRRPYEEAWEQLLQVPPGWLRDPRIEAVSTKSYPTPQEPDNRTVAEDIHGICCWYARKSAMHRTTIFEELNESERRTAQMLMQRLGLFGEDVTTLEAIGERHGLTRERVRQIEDGFMSRIDGGELAVPAIERLFALAVRELPMDAEEFDRRFSAQLGIPLSVISVDRFCRTVLGRRFINVVPKLVLGHYYHVVTPLDMPDDDVLRAVRQIALAEIRVIGAAQLHLVAGLASDHLGREVTLAAIRKVCQFFEGFEWLVEEDGWFWFGPDNAQRLRNTLFKLFSVAERPLDIEEIHQAITRARLTRYEDDEKKSRRVVEVPMRVLQVAVSRFPSVSSVRYDDFRYNAPLNPADHLAESELFISNAIRNHHGVIARQDLLEELQITGDSAATAVAMTLERSPVFVRLEPGIWTLRGVRFSGAAYDMAVSRWYNGKRVTGPILPDANGWCSMEITLPPSIFTQSTWVLPAAATRMLSNGIYTVENGGETMEFRQWDDRGGFLRYRHVFERCGIGPGDILRLAVNESERRLRIERMKSDTDRTAIGATDK